MTKTVTHINCPKEWESESDWDSHRPLLFSCLYKTTGNVYEFGCGYGSTLLINDFCLKHERLFYSYDTSKDWVDKMKGVTKFVENYINDLYPYKINDVLFIDCAPADIRKDLIDKWRNNVNVMIIHDTEPGAEYVYGMSEVLSTFKYRLDYQPEGKPHTTAISNFINIEEWV